MNGQGTLDHVMKVHQLFKKLVTPENQASVFCRALTRLAASTCTVHVTHRDILDLWVRDFDAARTMKMHEIYYLLYS